MVPNSGGAPGFRKVLVGSPTLEEPAPSVSAFTCQSPVGLARVHMTGQCPCLRAL